MDYLFIESMENSININSMECDIILDRLDLGIDHDTYMTEASKGQKTIDDIIEGITQSIYEALKKVIIFIIDCIGKISEIVGKSKIAKLENEYKKAVESDPSIKDKIISCEDITTITKERDRLVKNLMTTKADIEACKNAIEHERNIPRRVEKKIEMKIEDAISYLQSISDVVIKNIKEREKILDNIKSSLKDFKESIQKQFSKDSDKSKKNTHDNKISEKQTIYSNIMRMTKQSTVEETDMITKLYKNIKEKL